MAQSRPTKNLKENPLWTLIDQATQSQTPPEFKAEKARQTNGTPDSYTMSSLATATAAQESLPDKRYNNMSPKKLCQ